MDTDLVVESLARLLAGPAIDMLPAEQRSNALIPFRRQAGDVLALLHQLDVYSPRAPLAHRAPSLTKEYPEEDPGPFERYVTVSARHRGLLASQAIDPMFYADPRARHHLIDRLARMLERHWQNTTRP